MKQLVSRRAAALGLGVAALVGMLPSTPADAAAPAKGSYVTGDATMDSIDFDTGLVTDTAAADIIAIGAYYTTSEITLNLKVRGPVDPLSDPKWLSEISGLIWGIDTNNNAEYNYDAFFYVEGGVLKANVVRDSDGMPTCTATAQYVGGLYSLKFPPIPCIGGTGPIRVDAFLVYGDATTAAFDLAPEVGFTPLIYSNPSWHFETFDGNGGTNGRTANDVGGSVTSISYLGKPHAFYSDATTGGLRHGGLAGTSTWLFEQLDPAAGLDPSALVYGSALHVWYSGASGPLRHTWWNGSVWTYETVDAAGVNPAALTFVNAPRVFFRDPVGGNLRYARWYHGAWIIDTLDGAGGVNGRVDSDVGDDVTAFLVSGLPHAFYRDAGGGNLRHAWFNGMAWYFETLDGAGGVGGRVDADVGSDVSGGTHGNVPHVFYRDATGGNLRHASKSGAGWSFETVDGAGGGGGRVDADVGSGSSFALAGGVPNVFFYDATGGNLRHAGLVGPTWSFETVDGAGGSGGRITADVGAQSSSVIPAGGVVHTFFRDVTNGDLRRAWFS